jgi:sulfide:quinone oxidoreductase
LKTSPSVVIAGAGFGGLELATVLSDEFGDAIDVTLLDRGRGFRFGFSKLDVMFGRTSFDSTLTEYGEIDKPGVTFRNETVLAIDPDTRTVTTDVGSHTGDFLVVALGAEYDLDATPGLAEYGEFYSFEGAAKLAPRIAAFREGHVVIGVCGAPYKCPPAPSEAALLMHQTLVERGVRDRCSITFLVPFDTPVPPSPDTSAALLEAFAERDIEFRSSTRVVALDNDRSVALLDDGSELAFDLFLGVPKHRAPAVVAASGMTEDGYIPVEGRTLATTYPGVWAVGDVATVGTPKAGVFAERQAATVAAAIIADIRGGASDARYDGTGECYLEFGQDLVARVNVDFFSQSSPTGTFTPPSRELVAEKELFGSSRLERWFGAQPRT